MTATASQSLWAATAAPGPDLASLSGDLRAQVTIIGGGYTGLSAALHLAEALALALPPDAPRGRGAADG